MSAPAAPQITLEQARQLVVFLENGEQDKANQLILETRNQTNLTDLTVWELV